MTDPEGESGMLARARRRSVATVFVDAFLCAIGVLLIIILTLDPKRAEPPRPQYDVKLNCIGGSTYDVTLQRGEDDPAPQLIKDLTYRDSEAFEAVLTDAARTHPRLHMRLRLDETPDSASCANHVVKVVKRAADALSLDQDDGGAVMIIERWYTAPPPQEIADEP